MPAGGNIAHRDPTGMPTLVSGRVLDLDGKPIAGAVLDVWQAQTNGLYDSQDEDRDELHMRGKFRTDAEGRYLIRTVRPVNYPIPSDGPVGAMLQATGRHPWRPAHIHFVVSADGYEPVTTHHLRPHRPVSRQRCGVCGQGVADLRFRRGTRRRTPRRRGSASPALSDRRVRFPAEARGRRRRRACSTRSAGSPRSARADPSWEKGLFAAEGHDQHVAMAGPRRVERGHRGHPVIDPVVVGHRGVERLGQGEAAERLLGEVVDAWSRRWRC